MSRTEYVASKPTSELPLPRTRLLGTSVARQSYNSLQPGPTTDSHHHVPQTTPHSRCPAPLRRARTAGAGLDADCRARALGPGDDDAAAAPGRAVASLRRASCPARPAPQPASLRGPAALDLHRVCGDGAPVGQLYLHRRSDPHRAPGRLTPGVGAGLPPGARARAPRAQRPRPRLPRAREPLPVDRTGQGLPAGPGLAPFIDASCHSCPWGYPLRYSDHNILWSTRGR